MSKITSVGNCFVQVENSLINLKAYKEIEKYNFGYDEDPENHSVYGIKLTPLNPDQESIENAVDGSFFITEYTLEEKEIFESDFEVIISALKS
jgi:hypothetical protein